MGVTIALAKLALPFLAVVGVLGTYELASSNGFLGKVLTVITTEGATLPDSDLPLHQRYTGISQVDEGARLFVAFFWNVLNGSSPTTTLQAAHFYGQETAIWVLLLLESYRVSNAYRLVSFALITGLMVENVLMALIVPVYCVVHLVTSPTALPPSSSSLVQRKTSLLVHPAELTVLPWSIALGCLGPTAMILLSETGSKTQQIWVAVRQIHPVLSAIFHLVLSFFTTSQASFGTPAQRNRIVMLSLQKVYNFAMFIAVIPHVATVTLMILSQTLPAMFGSGYATYFSPAAVFWPTAFWSYDDTKVVSVAEGAHMFLQWDELVGVAAILVWAAALNRQALAGQPQASGFLSMCWKIVLMSVVGGPVAAAISLIRERDEYTLELPDDDASAKKTL